MYVFVTIVTKEKEDINLRGSKGGGQKSWRRESDGENYVIID